MVSRLLRFFLPLTALVAVLSAAPAPAGRSDAEEAERLYRRANDFVTNIGENEYSYAYLQFHWKRAQANLDRIARVYPHTPTGQKLASGELKIGEFEIAYFKDRVLPRVELKRLGSFDAVNSAIFLYNLDQTRSDEISRAALASILEVLSRQQRWNEALIFPVRDEDLSLRLQSIYRIAARYDQPKVMERLRKEARPSDLPALDPLDAEAMVFLGREPSTIDAFLSNKNEAVRLAALSALVDRELLLRRTTHHAKDPSRGIPTTHFSLLNPSVRDDVIAAKRRWFPQGSSAADIEVARFQAGLGQEPASGAPVSVKIAYVASLLETGQSKSAESFITQSPASERTALRLEQIRRTAEFGQPDTALALARSLAADTPAVANQAHYQAFLGRMDAVKPGLTVQPDTFSNLEINDPCVLAKIMMEWSLTPNRSIRGAAPWDAVVRKFLPGFANLPAADSDEVAKAAAQLKPY